MLLVDFRDTGAGLVCLTCYTYRKFKNPVTLDLENWLAAVNGAISLLPPALSDHVSIQNLSSTHLRFRIIGPYPMHNMWEGKDVQRESSFVHVCMDERPNSDKKPPSARQAGQAGQLACWISDNPPSTHADEPSADDPATVQTWLVREILGKMYRLGLIGLDCKGRYFVATGYRIPELL